MMLFHARRVSGYSLVAVFIAAAVSGCNSPTTPSAAADVIRPAKIEVVAPSAVSSKLRFPGRVRAEKRAELSFNVPGVVTEFTPREGTSVKAGQVIARIDGSVFQAKSNSARAEFERARTDLERYQRLWDKEQAVARSEVDDRRSKLEVARTSLASAEQELADTIIKAPFDGVITRRHLEAHTSVQAKQAIADLQDLRTLEVVINIPERIFRTERPRGKALAVFAGQEDHPVPVELKSYATEADPQTQSYEVVLKLKESPKGFGLLPGMSATVLPQDTAPQAISVSSVWVPLTSIVSDPGNAGEKFVWLVAEGGGVSRRKVTTAEIRGETIRLTAGLSAGERYVAAGVHALREGMKVRPLDGR